MCPSAYRVSGPPKAQGGELAESNLHQNLPWTGGDVPAKFHQDPCRGLDFHWPSTYQHLYPHLYIYIYILAEVPCAAWVNLLPAEHLKNVSFSY